MEYSSRSHAYVIGLGNNWNCFKKQSIFQDLEDIMIYFQAYPVNNLETRNYCDKLNATYNDFGCWSSHILCMEHAIKNNYNNILLLEDDCVFTKFIDNNEINLLKSLINDINPNYINFGPNRMKEFINQKELNIKNLPSSMTHFGFVSSNGMKLCMDMKLKKPPKSLKKLKRPEYRDFYATDDFWYFYTNMYTLSVKEKNNGLFNIVKIKIDVIVNNCIFIILFNPFTKIYL